MAQQFCTSCGTRIESADQRFCVNCGAALIADSPEAPDRPAADSQRPADYDLSGFGQMNHPEDAYVPVSYAPADGEVGTSASFSRERWPQTGTTQPIVGDMHIPGQGGGWQPVETQPYPQPAPPTGGSGAARIVIIASAVIVALVAVAFIVTNLGSCGSTPVSQPVESTASVSDDSSDLADADDEGDASDEFVDEADDDEDADDDAEASEDEIYRELADAYDTMGRQADGIKDVAATLNNTIFVSDRAKREAAASDAYTLQGQVADLLEDLRDLDVPSASGYYDDRKLLVALQEDLQKRIDVMCEAWDISLQYSAPKDHEAAITKPLGKDNDSSGVNIYKKDFENRYPGARPQK